MPTSSHTCSVDPDQLRELLADARLVGDLDQQGRRQLRGPGQERVVHRELLTDRIQVGDVLDPDHLLRLVPHRGPIFEEQRDVIPDRDATAALVLDDPAADGLAHHSVALTTQYLLEADGFHGRHTGSDLPS